MWLTYRKKYDVLWIMVMLLAICCRSTLGWIFDNDNGGLSEGDKCRVQTGGPGTCKRIETCEPYYEGLRKKTIAYSSLVRCALIGFNEVICCPTDGATTATGWGEGIDRPVATTTTTTTTTTTKRPIVIGDVTITGSDDPVLVGTSTLKTIVHNELEDPSNVWSWGSETTPTTPTTRRSTTTTSTTTTTTPIPDWMEPILPNWMKEALGNTTTTTTPRSQTSQPVLPAWMLEALNNASGSSNTFPAVTSIPVISTSVTPPPTTATTVQTVITRNTNERPSQAACRVYSGFNPASLTFHILDGVPVSPGDYPHMGGLIYPDGGGNDIDVRCGSSLISERFTLTAAHCVIDPLAQPTMVRFGVVILQPTAADDDMEPVDVEIEKITIHPDYRANLKYHDIAVIKLKTTVAFTPYIRPACLYSDLGDIDSAKQLVVIGWGVTNVETRSRSGILLMANLTSVPLDECNATHVEAGVQRSYRNGLDKGQYCAFDVGLKKDACQADSGGPLQLVKNKESTIVGIVSFGLSCGSAVPSVYARVAFYLSWIESIVWPSPS